MFYILNFQYEPQSASGNRLLAYYRALDQLGIDATVVFLFPNKKYAKINEQFKRVRVLYFWNYITPYRGPFRKMTLSQYMNRFVKMLKEGDLVYTYSISKLTAICQKIQGVKVYAERTEHPEASNGFPHPLLALSNDELISTIKHLNGLFVISQPLKDYYASLGLDSSKISIINMIVDPERFNGIIKKPTKDRYIAYCGSSFNNKDGVDELIRAFSIVAGQIPDVKLYIIGSKDEKDSSGNIRLVKDLGLVDRVVFTGLISAKDMPQILKNADVLALDRPDNLQAKYGFPTKLGEYLMTETPVVVTSVGDIPRFLSNGISALLARPCDPEDFASKLIWALTHKEEAANIGRNGKSVAIESFNAFIETQKMVNYLKLKNEYDETNFTFTQN